ncbi:GNAT family N-acetyltransferase [Paenibacillus sp. JX-17]|uniref:GNAT family N-acetyltransferase n=1 Tax=Paenibacillus lacisoli TaxID=3064525 RepID=A0ABT9C9F1_9BACL|nr:GNAT family N-acetyltransferase [Paenibacillus sp. JX-17]MDO7905886.1 GNAT family N-acetyltransferase [Paenibacillus sp. JX-17]
MEVNIRNYKAADANDIAEINFMLNLAYQYNGDYVPANIFCAELEGKVVAAGHLEPTESCEYLEAEGKDAAYPRRFLFDTDSLDQDQLEAEIMERMMDRAAEIKQLYPDKRIQVGHTCSHQDFAYIDFLLAKGFYHELNYFILKRDLTQPLPEMIIPAGIEVKRWAMETEEEQNRYLQAEKKGFDGESWSRERLNWFQHGSEWDTFTAFYQGEPVSSCMTWGISPERSATEQIFTIPEWRRRGIAQLVIVEALKFLRDKKHKTEAALGVVGSNPAALNLYKSLGYELIDLHVLMVKDIG